MGKGRKDYSILMTLRAANLAGPAVMGLNRQFMGLRANAAFTARALGMHSVVASLKGVRMQLVNVAGAATRALGPIGLIGGVASVAGLAALPFMAARAGDSYAKLAKSTGVTAEEVQQLQYAFERGGTGIAQTNVGIRALVKNIGEARNGIGEARPIFKAMHIDLAPERSTMDILGDLADRLSQISDSATRAAVSKKLFEESGDLLLPTLMAGRDGLSALMAEKVKMGIITNKEAQQSEEFMDRMTATKHAVGGLGDAIGLALLPVIEPMLKGLKDWVLANKDLIRTNVVAMVEDLSVWINDIDWKQQWLGLKEFGKGVLSVVEFFGGWKVALGGIALAMALGPIMAVGQLGMALGGLALKFSIFAIGPIISSLWLALASGIPIIEALGIAMMANPLGLMVVGVTAAIAAIVLLWSNWDAVVHFFKESFAWLKFGLDSILNSDAIKMAVNLVTSGDGPDASKAKPAKAAMALPRAAQNQTVTRDATVHVKVTGEGLPPGMGVQASRPSGQDSVTTQVNRGSHAAGGAFAY